MARPAAGPLHGVRVVEAASFVAVPSAGMTLQQLGAEVIRVDPPGGGSDAGRWPLASTGASLFWANLNKGKRSVTIDHRRPEGRELLIALATAPGDDTGVFLDNMVGGRRLTHAELADRRPDVIHVHVEGRRGGRPAVDYTVNAEVGVPLMTGSGEGLVPVNHVLPAWDLVTGMLAATCVSAALLGRRRTGQGAKVDVALADVALAGVAEMGWLAEADEAGVARAALGNHMYGCFGVDFATADRRRVMVVALTQGQWSALRDVTGTQRVFSALEEALQADLDDEGDRFRLRETIASILRPWFAARDLATLRGLLDGAKVLWAPYRDMAEVVAQARADPGSVVAEVEQPGIGRMLGASQPWRWDDARQRPQPAPLLSADTEAVLADTLGLDGREIGRLRAAGVVG
ncbi:CoA transferase [Modestobacter sp. Leaf380]|uniref:CoA transferase n=1 Tax=Modestobacter sp. Leaf380 TaxID=1736356 RepID=UPI0006FC8638|nr:CoA transferase [Modestobacter sp. Leaf380]KQS68272.1 mesaconyl-CoA isomerase [Modestobacter sp. Leaf380]